MKHTQKLLAHIGVIVALVFGISMSAQAVNEAGVNEPIADAQAVTDASSEFNVYGSLKNVFVGRMPTRDVDFYSFFAYAGDSIDIGMSGVDTSVALFGLAPDYDLLADNGLSSGMSGHVITESGMYTVAVANSGAYFSDGGTVGGGTFDEGDYSLSVSGMSMASMEINIDVKPRRHKVARIKLWKKRKVKVAILGEAGFDVADIDQSSLTFGAYGDENTLRKCKRRFKDVNGDGVPDLICKFSLHGAGFDADSSKAYLSGKTWDGTVFHGSDEIVVKEHRKVASRKKK